MRHDTYEQELEFGACDARVVDSHPTVPQLVEAVERAECAILTTPIDSAVLNPGGPGAAGTTLAPIVHALWTGKPIPERFDIIGFDPHGVGHRSDCRQRTSRGRRVKRARSREHLLPSSGFAERVDRMLKWLLVRDEKWLDLADSARTDAGCQCRWTSRMCGTTTAEISVIATHISNRGRDTPSDFLTTTAAVYETNPLRTPKWGSTVTHHLTAN